jgi:hypothetical protein
LRFFNCKVLYMFVVSSHSIYGVLDPPPKFPSWSILNLWFEFQLIDAFKFSNLSIIHSHLSL